METKLIPSNMGDHAFSKWLREHGWTGDYWQAGNSTTFQVGANNVALAIYDNSRCNYKLWILE